MLRVGSVEFVVGVGPLAMQLEAVVLPEIISEGIDELVVVVTGWLPAEIGESALTNRVYLSDNTDGDERSANVIPHPRAVILLRRVANGPTRRLGEHKRVGE